ncbi:MAG: group 1 truncated hemoglobin, partial [Betaproteobacteria bacterium]|nr:group 1 truncated hemoglobin [Betaproteobacteria bacterium]
MKFSTGFLFLLLAFTLAGPQAASANTLYERLGGEKVIVQVVSDTIDRTASDPATKRSFDKVDLVKLKKKVVEH